ncbi:MAG: hypothetical protein ACF8MF_13295 [Phycisphaerales bacterium JB052]
MSEKKREKRKPVMRIVRHMARSGGTLLGKCLGSMDSVVLLSEIHPAELRVTNPMMQAQRWFGLIDKKDIARWKARPPSVLQFVGLCDTRARAQSKTLVLRDWSHLDYIGVPYVKPMHGFGLGEALGSVYDLRVSVTTRHPVDQYVSLLGLPVVARSLDFDAYCAGCLRFAQYASEHGFHRYEDFTRDPDTVLRAMCEELDLEFDPGYAQRWFEYTTITGDTQPGLGRGSTKREIVEMPRREIDAGLLERFRANADYRAACELLGYAV